LELEGFRSSRKDMDIIVQRVHYYHWNQVMSWMYLSLSLSTST
jgi:hypothetical protein